MQYAKWLALLGDVLYDVHAEAQPALQRAARAPRPALLVARRGYLKHKVKNAVTYIGAFEQALAREARRARRCDGVVCGHIHHAEIRDIDGILYCNDGDWVESLTALVETCATARSRSFTGTRCWRRSWTTTKPRFPLRPPLWPFRPECFPHTTDGEPRLQGRR